MEIRWFKVGDSKSTFEHDSEREIRQVEFRSAKSVEIRRPKIDQKVTQNQPKCDKNDQKNDAKNYTPKYDREIRG